MSETATFAGHMPGTEPEPGLIGLAERGLIPDRLLRHGIRRLCAQRLREEREGGTEAVWERFRALLAELRESPLALHTDAANAQHYELPPAFFELCLGERLKYSSAYFERGDETLEQAEDAMLALYEKRAGLADGQDILELGCGWGSLTLWMAERYPNSRITAVSNSSLQRKHIQARCAERGLGNVSVITQDVNRLQLEPEQFDRAISIEMFEHMRNYQTLLGNIAQWLRPDGRLFVHIFCHRELMYPFETQGDDNWMGRFFFTGGLMPAADTLAHFQRDLLLEQQWRLSGTHYARTANAWLANQDTRRPQVMSVLRDAYGDQGARLWNQRWRIFWMSCAELFGFDHGNEWLVGHYLFRRH
ncbi:class I SAM-dependent methyltransferase [Oleiagrimonas sp. C23AA]|nr:class I SAM-dependent methyltransferase [Oleiagrimonas sp. C23AA]